MLRAVPLGGLGEIGLNALALESRGERLLVDCGLMFPRGDFPGVEIVVPDFSWLLDAPGALAGIVLTHAHEDHVGALPWLLRDVPVPVYGTRLTLALVRPKLQEAGVEADLREVSPGEPFRVGTVFDVEAVRVTHSVPDGVALVVRTPDGTVVHTGDFKLDGVPIDGRPTDLERLGAEGERGVDLLLSDSTNAEVEAETPPERLVQETFDRILAAAPGRVVVALFGSHLHRVQALLELAARHRRKVALVGRSLERNTGIALELGYLKPPPATLWPLEALAAVPPREVLILCTGAQGEPRSALPALLNPDAAAPKVPGLGPSDTVVLSSRVIPGNEVAVSELIDRVLARGAKVVHPGTTPGVHVSGHAGRPELRRMLQAVRPKVLVPVHGELRHLHAHRALAQGAGLPLHVELLTDGDLLQLEQGAPSSGGRVPVGRVLRRRDSEGAVTLAALAERRALAADGLVLVTVALHTHPPKLVWGPHVEGVGLASDEAAFLPLAADGARQALQELSQPLWADDARLREELVRGVRRVFRQLSGRRPTVVPTVVKL